MLAQILLLILSTACDLLTVALLARFILQALRAPFRNPLGQFLLAATNWMVLPVRRIIPSAFGYDTSSLLLAWLWQALFLGLVTGLGGSLSVVAVSPVLAIAVVAILEVVKIAIYMTMGVILVSAVFSWVNPYAPMAAIFNQMARPLLRPFQRVIPPLGGVDLSPLALLLVLQVLLIVLANIRTGLLPVLYGG
jgi:YggT family protein